MKLDAAARRALPSTDFALPGGRYPIPDKGHAIAAESDVTKFGSPAEKAKVDAAVHAKFAGLGQKEGGAGNPMHKTASFRDALVNKLKGAMK